MYFAFPWGLLGLVSLPVIVGIHLYHRRFPPLVVAGAHLWGTDSQMRSPGRRRDRLPITKSLLLELLAALLLTLLLSQPRFGEGKSVVHFVVVLDNSASMSAMTPDGGSFRDRAITHLDEQLSESKQEAVITLIVSGRRPVLLAGPAADWTDAEEAFARWRPSVPRHDFQPAWSLAEQLAGESGRLLFLTNRLPPSETPVPRALEIVSVGQPLDNTAISAARWVFNSQTNEGHVSVRLDNLGRQPASGTVSGTTAGQTVFQREVALESGASLPLEMRVPGGLGELTVTLNIPGDPLAIDNQVRLVEPKVRLLSVAMAVPSNEFGSRQIRRVLDSVPDLQSSDPDSAHLIIGPADTLPPSNPRLWWLGMGPLDRSESARDQAKDLTGPFLLEKRHPLLDGLALGGVIWGGVQSTDLRGTPLISAGSYPLLMQLHGTQTTAYLLNIDPARSNLSESPDWPILLNNLIELRRENLPGLRRWNYRLNEEIRFRLREDQQSEPFAVSESEAARPLQLVHRESEHLRPLARTDPIEIPFLEETGIYEVRDQDRPIDRFAVNFFDSQQSSLARLSEGTRKPAVEAEPLFQLDPDDSWLLILGGLCLLAVILLNWFVLQPKRQPSFTFPEK